MLLTTLKAEEVSAYLNTGKTQLLCALLVVRDNFCTTESFIHLPVSVEKITSQKTHANHYPGWASVLAIDLRHFRSRVTNPGKNTAKYKVGMVARQLKLQAVDQSTILRVFCSIM